MNNQAIPLKFDPHTNPSFASQELWIYSDQLMDEWFIWMSHECIHMIPKSRVEWRDEKGRENFRVQHFPIQNVMYLLDFQGGVWASLIVSLPLF